jgi:dimethylhistidine N-methyltransferase
MALYRNSSGEIRPERSLSLIAAHQELIEGLQSGPRRIPSKYLYDDEGSRIFLQITQLPEYYLTRCEFEILQRQSAAILEACDADASEPMTVVELGAGDGHKTIPFLRAAQRKFRRLTYRPVDISREALCEVRATLGRQVRGIRIEPALLDMEQNLARLPLDPEARNILLYLGSSIGNLERAAQRAYLGRLREAMSGRDFLFIGFDLKKELFTLQNAYDDSRGVTREFNLNLLRRLNREFGADFRDSDFLHWPLYNPASGAMESWLVSRKSQTVSLPALDCVLELASFEGMQVEISWKFSAEEISALAAASGFVQVARFTDTRGWFVDELWRRL